MFDRYPRPNAESFTKCKPWKEKLRFCCVLLTSTYWYWSKFIMWKLCFSRIYVMILSPYLDCGFELYMEGRGFILRTPLAYICHMQWIRNVRPRKCMWNPIWFLWSMSLLHVVHVQMRANWMHISQGYRSCSDVCTMFLLTCWTISGQEFIILATALNLSFNSNSTFASYI